MMQVVTTINLAASQLQNNPNVPQKDAGSALDEAERQLLELAAGIEIEELVTVAEQGAGIGSEGNDDVDGWVDEMEGLDSDEREELERSIQPVRLVLVKVGMNI